MIVKPALSLTLPAGCSTSLITKPGKYLAYDTAEWKLLDQVSLGMNNNLYEIFSKGETAGNC